MTVRSTTTNRDERAVAQSPAGRSWWRALGIAGLAAGLALAGGTAAQAQTRTAAPSAVILGGNYTALTPVRILDTRTGLGGHGLVAPQQSIDLQVVGRGGVPASGVSAVVVQVTSTQQSSLGYVTVYPSGLTRPAVSDLDFVAHVDTSNLVTVPVGANGKIQLFNGSGGSNQLIADVQGYFHAGLTTAPGAFTPLTPARILDTRTNNGATGVVAPFGTVGLQVTGRGGVPSSGVSAVAVNVTVTQPAALGYLTVFPAGVARPVASDINFLAGQSVPNLVIVPVGPGGKIDLFNGSTGSSHMIADVQGYFRSGSTTMTGGFTSLTPTRILDTRTGLGGSHRATALAETKIHVAGHGGVPASGVSAVVVNVTGVLPSVAGSLVAYPTGVVKPLASNLNFVAGGTRANLVIVPVDAFGWISLSNNSGGKVDEIADVAGYFKGTGTTPNVLGPYSFGPFTLGMTIAQAKVAYPALNPTFFNSFSCGVAQLPQAILTFNHGTGVLSFITPTGQVQTANGIHLGDTLGSVVSRFPWADITPDEPSMAMAVTKAELSKASPATYWFEAMGPRDPITDLPRLTDTIDHVSLDGGQRCFD